MDKTYKVKPAPDILHGKKVKASYSKISLFHECPRQFFYRYLTDVPERPLIYPGNLTGQVFHKALEIAIKMKNEGKKNQEIVIALKGKFEDLYNELVNEHKKDYRVSRELKDKREHFFRDNDRKMVQIVKFILSYFFTHDCKILSEHEFTIPWEWDDEISVTGIIDVQLIDEHNRIIDLKITKDPSTYYFVDWDKTIQDLMYEYFTYKTYNKLPVSFSYLVFDREGGTLFFKEKTICGEVNYEKYFSYLHNELQTLKAFVLKPDMELAHPEENKCKWCAYSDRCELKFESTIVKKMKKTIRRK